MTLSIAHHHGFKCAGSTFLHVLNRNWSGRVLHIEHRINDRRIHCDQVQPYLEHGHYDAVTSHLLTMPRPGEQFAHVHFGLVRDPIARLVSAYKFVPEESKFGGFLQFVAANRHHACDYHVRHLATPAASIAEGWRADPAAVPLGAAHVLLGLVERFDDSMFLLERRLAAVGCEFDGSVGGRQNVGRGDAPDIGEATLAQLRDYNLEDYRLYARVAAALDEELLAVDPSGEGRAEYRQRCAMRAGDQERYLGVPPPKWTYIEE